MMHMCFSGFSKKKTDYDFCLLLSGDYNSGLESAMVTSPWEECPSRKHGAPCRVESWQATQWVLALTGEA